MQKEFYRIIKVDSDIFVAQTSAGRVLCRARSKNKKGEILAGDYAKIESGVIQEVMERKNRLIRPAVANVDQVLFVICSVPVPDYFLLDKAIVNCLRCGIEAVICINKSDINDGAFEGGVRSQYADMTVISSSATDGEVDEITALLGGKLTALAGQSAVGKSSIVNAIFGTLERERDFEKKQDKGILGGEKANFFAVNMANTTVSGADGQQSEAMFGGKKTGGIRVGELSAIDRGRNTTTSVELYDVCGGLLADTPGFSLLDFHGVKSEELELYYPEFEYLRGECRYHKCTHTKEPDCAIVA
ncbi:MAG: GTPase RsgA, partial [Firmicutes bacterium]|nr:GTPase RsgA [Bacillota bacterium]